MGYEVTLIKEGRDIIEIHVQHGNRTLVLRDMILFGNLVRDLYAEYLRDTQSRRTVTKNEIQKDLVELNALGRDYWADYLHDVFLLGWDEHAVRRAIETALSRDYQR